MRTHSTLTTRSLLGRAFITLITLVALIASFRLPNYRLPFNREGEGPFSTVSAVGDIPLPAGLQPGDRIVVQDQSLRVRTLLVTSYVPPDTAYPFVIRRGNHKLVVPVSTLLSPEDGNFLWAVNLLTVFVISLLGLLTLWRGTSWSAWGLTMFASGVLCGSTVAQTPAAPFGNIALFMTGFLLTGPLPFLGLYLTATDLTGRSARARPRLTSLFASSAIGMFGFQVLSVVDTVVYGVDSLTAVRMLSYFLAACMVGIPLLVLTSGYVGAPADQKLRIRWVLASTAMLISAACEQCSRSASPSRQSGREPDCDCSSRSVDRNHLQSLRVCRSQSAPGRSAYRHQPRAGVRRIDDGGSRSIGHGRTRDRTQRAWDERGLGAGTRGAAGAWGLVQPLASLDRVNRRSAFIPQ